MPRERDNDGFTAGKDGGLPFIEAINYARSRKAELAADYYGNAIKAHRAKATTITGAASVAQIEFVMNELNAVLAEGGTFEDWKRTADVRSLLLPDHRLDNIFRTNVQAAYNRGRYQQQMTSIVRTYWMYDAINDSRVRPGHLAMDGVIRSRDDVWWSTRYPPNGYRCRCSVIALTEKQVAARGGVTGEISDDARPDPGWNYNPGADYFAPDAKIVADAAGASPRAAQTLAEVQAAAERARLSYVDLYRLGTDSLRADMTATGGHWTEGFAPVLSNEQAIRARALFLERAAAVSAGEKHEFAVKPTRAGVAPKALVAPVQDFFAMLPQRWQELIADSLRSKPLTVSDGIKPSRKRARGVFEIGKMHLVSPHDELNTIVHESAHALQDIAPDLDTFFQAHHRERTAGEGLESLRKRNPGSNYKAYEVTRPDKYFTDYVGKEYGGATNARYGSALELMSMTFEYAFSTERRFALLIQRDPRLLSVLYGLLFHYG